MSERFKLIHKGKGWTIMAHHTEAAWVTLGGCPSHMVAMRVYLALKVRGGR